MRILLAGLCVLCLIATARSARAVDSAFAGRVPCVERDGIRFCKGDVTRRVETWDEIPLDANVTLPPASLPPPYPLIIEEHGWSLGKSDSPFTGLALAGYAVLSYSARGFHASCGSEESRAPDPSLSDPNACDRGWTHLGDARYEVRDTQYLAGLLADDGWVIPDKVAVTGASYGGGRTIIAAALRNRVMLPDGTLVPWLSRGGLPMEIAACAALIPWSDLPASLVPNGATLDYRTENPYGSRAGVRKDQWNDTLYAAGLASGYYAPPGADPGADLSVWNARTKAGEPYNNDSATQALIDELTTYHSGYYIDDSIAPAPLFIYNSWTDDLFPANEGLRYWLKAHKHHPDAELAVLFADDFGHPRANLAFGGGNLVPQRVQHFLDRHLKGEGDALPEFETFTQACGNGSPLGAFTADTWDGLHPGEVSFATDDAQAFDGTLGPAAEGAAAVGAALAPLAGGPCRAVAVATNPGAATYVLPAATGAGYTLLGSPTILATFVVTGAEFAQVAARLWDVGTDGKQRLVSHGFYRPRTDNLDTLAVFQLPPNGWHFPAGHAPKLELLGQSVPMGHASAGPFTIRVDHLELRLPVHEAPDGGAIGTPALHQFPSDDPATIDCSRLPQENCTAASASTLVVVHGKRPAKDRLTWSWSGDASVDPSRVTAVYGATLCVWDDNGLLLSSAAPEAGPCNAPIACWTYNAKRARYHDKPNSRTGARAAQIGNTKHGAAASFVAGGERLGRPPLPAAELPITVQLLAADGTCLGAVYPDAAKNDAKKLKAKLRK